MPDFFIDFRCSAIYIISTTIIMGVNSIISEKGGFISISRICDNNWGVSIYSTGGETADVGDLVRSIIVDSTVTARIAKTDIIDNANIQAGDLIVGLSSSGQATYETTYNGGMGSNGLTSARHDVFANYLASKYPESFNPLIPSQLAYSGSKKLTENCSNFNMNFGKLVLSPTRTYAPIIKKVLERHNLREKINHLQGDSV